MAEYRLSFVTIFLLSFLCIFALSPVYAVPPTSPYLPGETTSPACAPLSPNCTVIAPAMSGINSNITSLIGLTTPLGLSQGGTGATSSAAALRALLPSQTGSAGRVLTTDGNDATWSPLAGVSAAWGTLIGNLSDQTDLLSILNTKEALIPTGTPLQFLRGDKTWVSLPSITTTWGNISGSITDQLDLQTLFGGKENTIPTGTAFQFLRGDKTWVSLPTITTTWGSIQGSLSDQSDLLSLFNTKEPVFATGSPLQFLRGDKTWASIPFVTTTWGAITGSISSQTDLLTLFSEKENAFTTGTSLQFLRGDKTWTTLNSTLVGLGNVENVALSTWSGSSSLTTLGTVTTGTWNGSTIPVAFGGTGTTTLGGIRNSINAALSGSNSDITSLNGLTTPLTILQGGTGTSTTSGVRSVIGAAAAGVNTDITSLGGLSTPLSPAQGGTGTSTLLSAGSIVYAGSGGSYQGNASGLYWDEVNGRLGIGTASPSSSLHVTGGITLPIRTVTGNTTLTDTDYIVLANITGGSITITLPDPANRTGKTYIVKAITTNGGITLNSLILDPTGSTLIEGLTTSLTGLGLNVARQIISNGLSWYVIGNN